jgi:hypothetical protein
MTWVPPLANDEIEQTIKRGWVFLTQAGDKVSAKEASAAEYGCYLARDSAATRWSLADDWPGRVTSDDDVVESTLCPAQPGQHCSYKRTLPCARRDGRARASIERKCFNLSLGIGDRRRSLFLMPRRKASTRQPRTPARRKPSKHSPATWNTADDIPLDDEDSCMPASLCPS